VIAGREKRLLLGALALLAPLPLPFNEILGWAEYGLFAAAVGAFLWRARRDPPRWLPVWASNVLALLYLPVLAADLLAHSGTVIRPVVHLGLFAVAVKLFTLHRERDKWHAVLGVFFLFLAAMATSVHLSIVLYLIGFLAAALLMLSRFALLHLLAGFGRGQTPLRVPIAAFLAVASLASALLAVPLFAVLPRVQSPYIRSLPGGGSAGTEVTVSGFSDEITLDTITRVRQSREVAMRLRYDPPVEPRRELRLKGGAFDRLEGGTWRRAAIVDQITKQTDDRVRLADGEEAGWVEIWLQPLGAHGLPLPVETLTFDVPRRGLRIDRGGAVQLSVEPRTPLQLHAGLGREPVSAAAAPVRPVPAGEGPPVPSPDLPSLDTGALTPRMAELADRVAGGLPDPGAKARALRTHLQTEYGYTLDLIGRGAESQLEDFLFRYRRGHCELFASSLVLLLRSQGIPARLISGFLGGEKNPRGYWVVRQENAHVWVEAWLPETGWTLLDPTPELGRPASAEQGLVAWAEQLYDSLVFLWDRHVLAYDVEDQLAFVGGALKAVLGLWRSLTGGGSEPVPAAAPETAPATEPAGTEEAPAPAESPLVRRALTAALVLLAAILAVLLWRRSRGALTATHAYRDLRRRLERSGLPLTESTGPLTFERAASARYPQAALPAHLVVHLYLEESFGGRPLDDTERDDLRYALGEARRALRRAG